MGLCLYIVGCRGALLHYVWSVFQTVHMQQKGKLYKAQVSAQLKEFCSKETDLIPTTWILQINNLHSLSLPLFSLFIIKAYSLKTH